ncbi:rab escort protein 1 isoform X1 [Rhodamnia argentea]|uniref:Rab escort protein 1 n=1 Tax=Rhodamnia argentea TaxID=178133 RepID=A0A8B8NPI0_9MYRT|nr:rab escort protein 1 isoform X1 [Rhodamnia argentea]
MTELPPYPPIEPSNFDLIIVGTGLPESILAAAASAIGKSVLHLDPNPFYGSHFASLPPDDLSSFLDPHPSSPDHAAPSEGDGLASAIINLRSLYSDVEISSFAPETLEQHSRKFNLDLAGPRVLFCADKAIDAILRSGANQYVEFKSIDASLFYDKDGNLVNVPDSRAAIFKDKSLSLVEKNVLMRFFKLVQQHFSGDGESDRISEEDLASPFFEFLAKMRLPEKIKSVILYAISMADYDQGDKEACKVVISTKDGIERLALYHSSVGRFPNAVGALIYPIYGLGELAQAFCRRAAVKGCIYVLRMPVIALHMDKECGQYRGVRLGSGQDIFSHKLVLEPSFTVQSSIGSQPQNSLMENVQVKAKVARGICILTSSLRPDVSNFLIVYPPRSLYPEQVTSVRVLQIGGNLAVCPSGMFVLYLSALCDEASWGKKILHRAINALINHDDSKISEGTPPSTVQTEDARADPLLLWRALYIQELTAGQVESVSSTPMPDGSLGFNDALDATVKLFQTIYPHEEFFPETPAEDPEDDGALSVET